MASQKGTKPLVLVWNSVRTPAALSCASTAPAAVPEYITEPRAGDGSSGAASAACCGAAAVPGAMPSAMPVAAVAARKSLRETVLLIVPRVRDWRIDCQHETGYALARTV